jgi:hypothetical protein
VPLAEHDILDVGDDLVALGNVVGAAVVDEPDAADVDADCWPMVISRPPTLTLALPRAVIICGIVTL